MHRQNPFETPQAQSLDPGAPRRGGGTGSFEVGRCLSEAWEACWANFPLWLTTGIVFVLVAFGSFLTVVGWIAVLPVLTWGGARFLLNMYDRTAQMNDIFAGFKLFAQAWVSMFVIGLGFLGVYIVPYAMQIGGALAGSSVMSGLGSLASLVVVLGIVPRLMFAYFYVVDRDMGGVDALKESWAATKDVWLSCVLLMLLTIPIFIAGMFALLVGVIPATTITYLMFASAYRQMNG